MKKINLTNLRTIPVFIEDSRYEAPAWEAFEAFRSRSASLGQTDLTLEFYTNKARFEEARKRESLGIVATEEWEHINHFTGDRPISFHWDRDKLETCYYGVSCKTTTPEKELPALANEMSTFLKDCRYNSNVVYYRGKKAQELPQIDGVRSYSNDITPNTLLQNELAIFDAEKAPMPVCQSPYASFSHNIVLDASPESTKARRWSATMERDSYTMINPENSTHIGRPTKRGFRKLFTTLFYQAGTFPCHRETSR